MNRQLTATGALAEAFSPQLYLFRFLFQWSTNRHQDTFLEQQRLGLAKWNKKQGKQRASNDTGKAGKIPAAAPPSSRPNTTPPPADSAIPTTLILPPPPSDSAAGQNPDEQNLRRVQNVVARPAGKATSAVGGPSRPRLSPAENVIDVNMFSSDEARPKEMEVVNLEGPRIVPAGSHGHAPPAKKRVVIQENAVAGPSQPKTNAIAVKHKTAKRDHGENRRRNKRDYKSSSDEEEDLPQKSNRQDVFGRRPAEPTGRFFEPPCTACGRRGRQCQKDANVAACVSCYTGKIRCNYAARRRQTSKTRGDKRKGKQPAKRPRLDDPESEEEMSGDESQVPPPSKRPAKIYKSRKFIEDSDEDQASGNDTTRQPPTSRSPSPLPPRRAAARKANIAIAAIASTPIVPERGRSIEGESKLL